MSEFPDEPWNIKVERLAPLYRKHHEEAAYFGAVATITEYLRETSPKQADAVEALLNSFITR